MALLQPKLNLKVAQRQVLTPGLMQMVSVLALNKLELKEMIDAEMVENPVLEEIDESVPMLDEVAGREELLERSAEEASTPAKDVFTEIDFGSYFQEYLDPGYRTQPEYEESEKPSFENFLSQPTTLTDHLAWQLGALSLDVKLHAAAELVIGNLDQEGYLAATDEELAAALTPIPVSVAADNGHGPDVTPALEVVRRAIELVQSLDPAGVAARDLRECLLLQITAQRREFDHLYTKHSAGNGTDPHRDLRPEAESELDQRRRSMEVAGLIVDRHLHLLQKRDLKDLARAAQITPEEAHAGVEFIRTLDPRPGLLYNREQTRLIEPDVVFVKRGGEWTVSMNEEDLPSLRLSQRYRRMLVSQNTDKEVKDYVKERFRSAMQLMRNIAQRKSTILRTCEVIVRRQQDFLEHGVESLRPMMIKEVAEEIGVHPSTVSRAVANKYAHTPQGVLELRFFFSEGANGPEGADTPLLVLKRKVRKLIEDEDPRRPLTDDQLAAMLQSQGIQLTRRTVAKYREDMNIPSTHQRRKRD
ncbi:MAG TPA: RNA polymerase sigma-54 factor [Terracidiphilus sp.]|jgi:RNA polymerase sigma-54 factor|nr:RNA polymerase sigma-54 factor [Terracidiphilus sp.]